jgi:hypothetical protein
MRVLFDENVPDSLRYSLNHHQVALTVDIGWARLRNGLLLRAAEDSGFDVLVTADQNIQYQQNLSGRKIAMVVLGSNRWPLVRNHLNEIVSAVDGSVEGTYAFIEIQLPPRPKRPQR